MSNPAEHGNDSVTIDDVAVLAFKIANELWGEEEVKRRFGLTDASPQHLHNPATGKSSGKRQRHKNPA